MPLITGAAIILLVTPLAYWVGYRLQPPLPIDRRLLRGLAIVLAWAALMAVLALAFDLPFVVMRSLGVAGSMGFLLGFAGREARHGRKG